MFCPSWSLLHTVYRKRTSKRVVLSQYMLLCIWCGCILCEPHFALVISLHVYWHDARRVSHHTRTAVPQSHDIYLRLSNDDHNMSMPGHMSPFTSGGSTRRPSFYPVTARSSIFPGSNDCSRRNSLSVEKPDLRMVFKP